MLYTVFYSWLWMQQVKRRQTLKVVSYRKDRKGLKLKAVLAKPQDTLLLI